MGNLLFWLGIGAAQKGAGSKPIERRHRALSFAVGTLIALSPVVLRCGFWSSREALVTCLHCMPPCSPCPYYGVKMGF